MGQTSPVSEMMGHGSVSHMSRAALLLKKKKKQKNTAIILNIIQNIFNLRETEVIICIILVLFKRTDGLNYHLNIR